MLFESILYVDDDPDICSIVAAALRRVPDLQVRTVNSGELAIDLAYEMRPALVLMDVLMPGLDGPSTLKRMHASALLARIPIVFMTAKALPMEIAELMRLGASGVIVKPFDPLALYDNLCALWTKQNTAASLAITADRGSEVAAGVDPLTASFLRRARADALSLETLIKLAYNGDRSEFGQIERIAHSIHGTGAMFGFTELSATGGAIARLAEELETGNAQRDPAWQPDALLQLLERGSQLAQDVEAACRTAPQSVGMFQGTTSDK